ncbi:ABC transporter ATP-binding protein [Marinicrinis lubricantis]|uniref:ABC transporter ATP-binding protein n=1 Tax=Marinicrinis lubricantis TaxID=2086470 RepID=A0ABW1IKB7_9BACL
MIAIHGLKYRMKAFQLHIERLELMTGLTLLVGKNGAGKSSLLKLLATACSPGEGQIIYDGYESKGHIPVVRSQIGYVPSHVELYGDMNPQQFLQYFAQLKGIDTRSDKDPITYWMERLEIDQYKHKKLKKCSLGMQHRVLFAQALLGRPRYILLDEPLNYLDQRERERMMDILSELSPNRLIVVASHELNEWARLASRIIWLDQGEIRFEGSPQQWVMPCNKNIWEGWIDLDQSFSCFEKEGLVSYREIGGRAHLVWIGQEPPFSGLANKIPDWEEAYLVRSRIRI